MKPKKLTDAKFLEMDEKMRSDRKFFVKDEDGIVWRGEMARAKQFGMTRKEYRDKRKAAMAAMEEKKVKAAAKKTEKKATPAKKAVARKPKYADMTIEMKARKIVDKESRVGRYYIELPDGLQLIFDDHGYVGWHHPGE